MLERITHSNKIYTDNGGKELWTITLYEEKPNDKVDGEIVKHLQSLFGELPVFSVGFTKVETTHDKTLFSDTAIHYHMNHFGDDKPVITFEENYENRTISFWLFDDKIVFQREEGIDTW